MHNYKSTFEDPFKTYFRLSESQTTWHTCLLYDYNSWSSYLRCDYFEFSLRLRFFFLRKEKKKEEEKLLNAKLLSKWSPCWIYRIIKINVSINHYRFNNNPILLFTNDRTNVRRWLHSFVSNSRLV